jgi:hypothetical protein
MIEEIVAQEVKLSILDFINIMFMLENTNIEKGNISNLSSNKKGVLIKSKHGNIYNLYSLKEFNTLSNFARDTLNNKEQVKAIKNSYLSDMITKLYDDIIDKIDCYMLNKGLLPIFSTLCGVELKKNNYIIELKY